MSLAFEMPEDITAEVPVVAFAPEVEFEAGQIVRMAIRQEIESSFEPVAEVVTEPVAELVAEEPKAETSQVVADAPKPTAAPDELDSEKYFLLLDLTGQLADAERYRLQCQGELDSLREDVKEAKEALSHATSRCHAVTEKIMAEITGTARKIARDSLESPKALPQPTEPTAEDTITADPVDLSWRDHSTAELLAGIKGMGKKKLETLVEIAPTVGQLEDLRATCWNGDFREVLPKGFGTAIAQAIEDATLEFVRKHNQAGMSCAEQVKLNQPAEPDNTGQLISSDDHVEQGISGDLSPDANKSDGQKRTKLVSSEPEACQVVEPPAAKPIPMSADEVQALLDATRDQAESEDWDEARCQYKEGDQFTRPEVLAGYKGQQAGLAYDSFPADYSASQVEYWIDGWVSAERLAALKAIDQDEFADL